MPNVTALPRTLENGRTLTQFTDTTSTTAVTYTYPIQQTGIQIENSGEKDIFVTVGSYTNQLVKADTKWKVTVSFTSFSISSVVNSQEFIATTFIEATYGTVKQVNGAIPDANGNVTIPQVDTSTLATKTEVQAVSSGSPKGTYSTLSALQTAFPTGNTNIYLVAGNVKEVASLTVTAIPTTAGNVTVTLNGVATNIAVDPAVDTTTALVATKIRNTTYSTGAVTGGTGSTITFTASAGGVKTDATYSAGTTGATGTMTTTTQGVNADGNWYYWNGSAWTAGGVYQSTGLFNGIVTPAKTSYFDIVVGKNKFNKNNVIPGYYVEYNTAKMVANASYGYMDYEEIKPNTLYTLNVSSAQTSFYDSSMGYISGHLSALANRSFTTPSNAKYFSVSIDLTVLNTFMIVEGDTLGTYEVYSRKETINTSFLPATAASTLGKLIIADINGKGNYTTITDAINAAIDGDTIYVLPGIYRESITIRSRNVNIIGFDKELCILKYDDISYSNPPLDLAKGNVSNMTIYAEKLSGAVASGTTPYAVHIDAIESLNSKLTFNNCRLISDWNAGAGIGVMGGFTLTFNDCELLSNEVTNTNGGVFFHDAAVSDGYGIGNIIFNRCIIKSKSDIAIMPSSSGVVTNNNSVYMTFYNTMIYSDINGKTTGAVGVGRPVTGSGWRTYNNFFLNADSFNNNIALFNA